MDGEVYKKVNPRGYVDTFLAQGVRPDGRAMAAFRKTSLNTGSITTALGSSMCKIGHTTVVCGITATLSSSGSGDVLEIEVQAGPFASRYRRYGNQALNAGIEAFLTAAVSRHVNAEELVVLSGDAREEYAWNVKANVYILNDDGNARDTALLATIAALNNTRLPSVSRIQDDDNDNDAIDVENEDAAGCELRVDEADTVPMPFDCAAVSYAVSFSTYNRDNDILVLADPASIEQERADSHITVLTDGKQVTGVHKAAGKSVPQKTLEECFKIALLRTQFTRGLVDQCDAVRMEK